MNRGPGTGDQIGNRGSDDNSFISGPIFKNYKPQHRSQCPQPYSVKKIVKTLTAREPGPADQTGNRGSDDNSVSYAPITIFFNRLWLWALRPMLRCIIL